MSTDWRTGGVRVVPADALDDRTPQTPGMHRAAAVGARTGATGLWAGTVAIEPDARTGAHTHGELESVIYVVSGRARMRWGDRLEFLAEAGPGRSSTYRRTSRTRRRTRAPLSRCTASSPAPASSPWC